MHRVHPGSSTRAWAMSIVSFQWDKEEWHKPTVIKSTASFQRVKRTHLHPNTTSTLHYKQDLRRLNCASVQDQLPPWATSAPRINWYLLIILTKPWWAAIPPHPQLRIWSFPSSDKTRHFSYSRWLSPPNKSLLITRSTPRFCRTSTTAPTLLSLKGPARRDLAVK